MGKIKSEEISLSEKQNWLISISIPSDILTAFSLQFIRPGLAQIIILFQISNICSLKSDLTRKNFISRVLPNIK